MIHAKTLGLCGWWLLLCCPVSLSTRENDRVRLKEDDIQQRTIMMRKAALTKRKQKGLLRKRSVSLSSVLFPGASPNEFARNEDIPVWIDSVDSRKTQIAFSYYKLPFCPAEKSDNKIRHHRKNLGERLSGRQLSSVAPYKMKMVTDSSCTVLCSVKFGQKDILKMKELIRKMYTVHLSLDSLPIYVQSSDESIAVRGYPLGSKLIDSKTEKDEFFLHNHLRFTVDYNDEEVAGGLARIVGFSVKPVSFNHDGSIQCKDPSPRNNMSTLLPLKLSKDQNDLLVTYSYEVKWRKVSTVWADRWDVYLLGRPDDTIAHHMSIINSFMVVLFLATVVAVILIKALRRDIAIYNDIEIDVGEEEAGWKLLHGDVFRPPSTHPTLLAVCIGSGSQICFTIIFTLLLGMTRLLNPMKKGQTLTFVVLIYVFSGSIAGYVSSRFYKLMGGKKWKLCTIMSATLFPGVCMTLFLILNCFLASVGAATTVSFWVIIGIFLLWAFVSAPLICFGSFLGYKKDTITVPTRTNQIARVVQNQSYTASHNLVSSMILGGLPFSTVCVEMYFIMGAIWLHQFLYFMGYLLTCAVLLGTCCALMGAVITYIQFCSEDHRWWWRAFLDSAMSGLWFFLYSLWYLVTQLELIGFLPVVVYLTYMSMISLVFALFCGFCGFISSFCFTKAMYGAVKID